MKKRLIFILTLLYLISSVSAEVSFKISGKVLYEGNGIQNFRVRCEKVNHQNNQVDFIRLKDFFKETHTNINGEYYFYVPNGKYALTVRNQQGLISKDDYKMISVDNKNIINIVFFLKIGCEVSGYVKFEDGTLIEGAGVAIFNSKSAGIEDTDKNGYYKVNSLRPDKNTTIKVEVMNSPHIESRTGIVLTEGMSIEHENFIIPKNLSLRGKVVDKQTNKPLKGIGIFIIGIGTRGCFVESDENGKFHAYNIKKGNYLIQTFEMNYNLFKTEIEFKTDEVKKILIELEKKQ